jgi:hypothetical protein
MRIDGSGRVGIGTSNPGVKVDILSENNTSLASVLRVNSNNVAVNTSLAYDGLVGSGQLTVQAGASAALIFGSSATERLRIDSAGNVGIGTSSPTTLLDVNADTIRVRTARTPASASATGATGEICWDANYIYVCTATNTWKRTAISTW